MQPSNPYPNPSQPPPPEQFPRAYAAPVSTPNGISPFRMRIYFTSFPFWAAALGLLGLFFMIGGAFLFGLIFLIIGGGWIGLRYALSISDETYDKWVASQNHITQAYALSQLRLDQSQLLGEEPLVIRGFVTPDSLNDEPYKSNYNPNEVRYRRGADGNYRFSVNTMTYFFPLKNELAAFTGAVSALAQEARNEQGYTYFYRDIVGISTDRTQTRYKLSLSSLGVLLGDPSVNIAFSLAVLPLVLSFGLSILGFRLENLVLFGFAGFILAIYPLILIGDLIWFLFFRQRNLQSQKFAVEVTNGNAIGAVVGFITPRKISFFAVPPNPTEQTDDKITTFAPDFTSKVERLRSLLRSHNE